MATETVKQKILQVVERLPDTATLEDAIERLCFLAKVEEGLRRDIWSKSDKSPLFSHRSRVSVLRIGYPRKAISAPRLPMIDQTCCAERTGRDDECC